jgi:hypothetical protein
VLVGGGWQDEVVIAASGRPEPAVEPPAAGAVWVEELARRRGVRPVASVQEMGRPGLSGSGQARDEFLAGLYAARRAGLA